MESWYIYAILASFFAALSVIFVKIGLSNTNPLTVTAIRSIFMVLLVLSIALYFQRSNLFNISSYELYFIILSGIAGALSWILFFFALKNGDTVVVSLIDRSSILFIILLSILFINEQMTLRKVIASILIIVALYLLAI